MHAQPGEDRDHQVEDHPGVDPDPSHGEQPLDQAGHDRAAPAEGPAPEDHLVHAGAVADDVEQTEDRAAHQVAERDDRQGLDEAQPEGDAEGAEHPVDRRDVGAAPDPELLPGGGVPGSGRNGLGAVLVEAHRLRPVRVRGVVDGHGSSVRDVQHTKAPRRPGQK
ncbi:hypothetical protein LUX33_02070 [Actinomadura madurae]|nr:hypothetical protein [Actinomadura madurae]MCP9947375.1 hypothetical protein [Actinomadura madurae]MCP9976615.1 hypothetical protein [Actinomadura madurae]MCQ0011892.1 hypothetical protein [Actinomadura madurae]